MYTCAETPEKYANCQQTYNYTFINERHKKRTGYINLYYSETSDNKQNLYTLSSPQN